jgi:hypothetical protein
VFPPGDHEYVYGVTPPLPSANAIPSKLPLHDTFFALAMLTPSTFAPGWVIVAESMVLYLLVSIYPLF